MNTDLNIDTDVLAEEIVKRTGVEKFVAVGIAACVLEYEPWDSEHLKPIYHSCGIDCCGIQDWDLSGPSGKWSFREMISWSKDQINK